MVKNLKKLPAIFYRTSMGVEPVRELTAEDRRVIGFDNATAEFGWPLGMPLCRSMGGGLWEIRSHLDHGRIARVFFCVSGGSMVLLHGFVKKSRKTPLTELTLALRRYKEIAR